MHVSVCVRPRTLKCMASDDNVAVFCMFKIVRIYNALCFVRLCVCELRTVSSDSVYVYDAVSPDKNVYVFC